MAAARYKTGKKPYVEDPRDLRLTRYLTALPPIPTGIIGHADLVPDTGWGVLGNDDYGDCVWAGAAHETILWLLEAGTNVSFTDANVLADYSAVTGFDKRDPSSDQGTDMREALLYRKGTGVIDAAGKRHKISAFVAISSIDELKRAIYLFGAAAIGIQFPDSAMDQFDRDQAWDVVSGAEIDGGHYVPGISYDSTTDLFTVVTWGREQPVTPRFLAKYMDEAYAVLSPEFLRSGKSLEGFNLTALAIDLAHIGDPVPTPSPTPTPTPTPPTPTNVDDQRLWALTKTWAAAKHVRDNAQAAKAVKAWAAAKRLL